MADKNIDQDSVKSKLVTICVVQGDLTANVIKSHLESEGIPVFLKWESVGKVLGITVDGLGQVEVMVPHELAEEAKCIVSAEQDHKPQE